MKRLELMQWGDSGSGREMSLDKEKEVWFMVTSQELEENSEDHGSMFCEDCRSWHPISYSQAFADGSKVDYIVLGFYECGEQTCLWSIDGKRVD